MFKETYHDGILSIGDDSIGFYYDERMENPIYSLGFREGCDKQDITFTLYLGNISEHAIKNIKIIHGDKIIIENSPTYLSAKSATPMKVTMFTKGTKLSSQSKSFDIMLSCEVE